MKEWKTRHGHQTLVKEQKEHVMTESPETCARLLYSLYDSLCELSVHLGPQEGSIMKELADLCPSFC